MWQVTLAINTVKALLPFQDELRALKRRLSPYTGDAENCRLALRQGLDQVEALRRMGFPLEGAEVLDLGSGWNPVIPLLFRVAGARRVHLTDLERLLDRDTVLEAASIVVEASEEIARRIGVPPERTRAVLGAPAGDDLDALLASLGLTYTVPFDSATQMPPVDLVTSRTVLEHIPPAVLLKLFRDFRKGLRPGGAMSHVIDHSDHREHGDKSLSRIDFLRHSEALWKLFCVNPQDYTNRLRHADYTALMREAGYEIALEEREVDARSVEDARTLKLWGRFADLPPEEVATLTSHVVARPA
jgi:SAM-dependent methyltransferase